MSDFPLEMSDDARVWLNRTLQQLENGLQSESQFLPSFSDPADPVWAIFAARELIESWDTYAASDTRFARASLERLIQRVAQWLRSGLRVDKLPAEEIAFQKLITVQAATQLFLKVRTSRYSNLDGALLQIAFASGHPTAIQMGVDFLLQTPPQAWTSASLALSPLLQYDDWDIELVFPRIWKAVSLLFWHRPWISRIIFTPRGGKRLTRANLVSMTWFLYWAVSSSDLGYGGGSGQVRSASIRGAKDPF